MYESLGQRVRRELAGILRNIARDTAGNTLAIMAAMLIPLIGFSGSAIDMARLYVVKTRLQQACDAGVLAGRKAMTDTSTGSTTLDSTAAAQANSFFANNFPTGWFRTSNVTFTPTKSVAGTGSTVANVVTATASAKVPLELMGFFGAKTPTVAVTCQARFDLADNDIMFVLDTTGSMSCAPSDSTSCVGGTATYTRNDGTTGIYNVETSSGGTNTSKMEALRQAVLLFDTTMRTNADSTTHFRYGFVPYSLSVNVGGSIPSQYLQAGPTWYQTRTVSGDYNWKTTTGSLTGVPKNYCFAPQRYPATGYALDAANGNVYDAISASSVSWTSASGGTCSYSGYLVRPMWHYAHTQIDTTAYLNSIGSGPAVDNPTRVDPSTNKWRGCVEELDTTPGTIGSTSLPDDLNPDVVPSSSTDKWRPMWQEVEWLRNGTTQDLRDDQINEDGGGNIYYAMSYPYDFSYGSGHLLERTELTACGMPAQRLQVMTAQQVHDYVYNNDFRPWGMTYHDVGMIWGTRMLSPTGIFKNDTAAWPGRNDPQRSIVFMTDGTMETNADVYGQYGLEALDGRVDGGNTGSDPTYHTQRFRRECDLAKAHGITIYVVALGLGISSDLSYCASPGQTFAASSKDQLTAAFKTIATRVAMLRIIK